ncbi:hypothetical protein F4677DRAFT_94668 [Hypoxylon crocopeplum]|nr:hypothetical protein F4677DRAFT_94668 [Hypoxylon crocopeplum]
MNPSGPPPLTRPALASHIGYNNSSAQTMTGGDAMQELGSQGPGPAYVLECIGRPQNCSRRPLAGADALRTSIFRRGEPATPDKPSSVREERRLFVVRGLPADYLQVLRDLPGLDQRFVEAHIGRRSYRPFARRRRGDGDDIWPTASFACFDYPELFVSPKNKAAAPDGLAYSADTTPRANNDDVVGDPPTHVISPDGDVVMFCRASLWLCPEVDVLLLDRPTRTHNSSDIQKVLYHSSSAPTIGKSDRSNSDSNTSLNKPYTSTNTEIPSLETLLYEALSEQWAMGIDMRALVEDIALHQWTEFFDTVSADLAPGALETTALYWQMQKSLERNLSASELYSQSLQPSDPPLTSAWEALLSRLTRHTALLTNLNAAAAAAASVPTPSPINPTAAIELPPRRPAPNTSSSSDANQHSLDRVSYMGGVLLPLSIVSSILSMSDPFGPGGGQFFVFWAVSVPLVIVTVVVIYADSLRKAEVWIEVATSTASSENGAVEMPDLEQAVPVRYGRTSVPGRFGRAGVTVVPTSRVGVAALGSKEEEDDDESVTDAFEGPTMVVEKLFQNEGKKKWKKEQLGWTGACKAVFRIYKLKKGRPPNRMGNTGHRRMA